MNARNHFPFPNNFPISDDSPESQIFHQQFRSCALSNSKAQNVYKNFSGVDYDDFHLLFYDDFSTDKNGMEKSYEKRVSGGKKQEKLSRSRRIRRNVHILELL